MSGGPRRNRTTLWRHALRAVLALLMPVCGDLPAAATEIDWAAVERDATDFLSAYIQIDTTNPPGNETPAARFLADRFRSAGIGADVYESQPGRGSVLARLPARAGAPERGAVILLNHLDVVPATPDGWEAPPFAGVVRDGYVYGRGALDCKGVGVIEALAMLLMQRHGIALQRDVIFLGTADEEAGGKLGAGWMVAEHFDQLHGAAFVLNEGGSIRLLANDMRAYEIAVSEKTPCWLRLTANGAAGHGSSPPPQTAVTRLVGALERVRNYHPELRVVPEVAGYYAALADLESGPRQRQYKRLATALRDPHFRDPFLTDRRNAALVHNTITPTVLRAGQKTNVIPDTATAELDCRLLPGESPEKFIHTVTAVVGDPDVRIEMLLNFPPSASSTDTPLYAAVSTLAGQEQSRVIPSVLTGFTDSHYFRERGLASYGFLPFALNEDDEQREHGTNERISTANLRDGTRQLIELLQILDREERDHGRTSPATP